MGTLIHLSYVMFMVGSLSLMTAVSIITLRLKLYRFARPERNEVDSVIHTPDPAVRPDVLPGLVLVPVRDEPWVLRTTVEDALKQRLVQLGLFAVGIIVSFREGDDTDTLLLAQRLREEYPDHIVLIPAPPERNKPAALNEALEEYAIPAGYGSVFVLDAETGAAPGILDEILYQFQQGHDIVTGPVLLTNAGTDPRGQALPSHPLSHAWHAGIRMWKRNFGGGAGKRHRRSMRPAPKLIQWADPYWARFLRWQRVQRSGWWRFNNCLEYFTHFSSRLGALAAANVITLPGNTIGFTIDALRRIGMVPECLTEDAAAGMKACRAGLSIKAIRNLKLASREVTPETLGGLDKQRTRWDHGFIQVIVQGDWKALPTRFQRLFAAFLLFFPLYQAYSGLVCIPLLVLYFTKGPVVLAVLGLIPFGLFVWDTIDDVLQAKEFARETNQKLRLRDYIGLVLGKFPFQLVLSLAAIKATWRYLRGKNDWHKTSRGAQSQAAVAQISGKEAAGDRR